MKSRRCKQGSPCFARIARIARFARFARVTTAEGRLLYTRTPQPETMLVDSWVAAGITDLLQTAVNTGTGRAAQIGRPVAGKTGTTSSNKDGWFLGFSSGMTTGVWMGRDDARSVAGLQGGAAPARAFAAFMRQAVANRPVVPFRTAVELPQWQLENPDEAYYGEPGEGNLTDDNGMPIQLEPDARIPGAGTADDGAPRAEPQLDSDWIDQMTGGGQDTPGNDPPPPQRRLPPRPPLDPPPEKPR